MGTVFIRIVAAATINFSLAGVWLLIEGGSYSRTAFIYLEGYLCADPVVFCSDRLVFQNYFSNSRDIMIEKQQQNQARDIFCHVFASNRRSFMACEHGHTHLIVFTHACGYYSGCGFYSNKYGILSINACVHTYKVKICIITMSIIKFKLL